MDRFPFPRSLGRFAAAAFLATLMLPLACAVAQEAEALEDPIPEEILEGDIRIGLKLIAEEGLDSPVYLTHADDDSGRLFVVDQVGTIRILQDGELLEQLFLDISDRLVDLREGFDERGLLGLAFHPGFADPSSPGHLKLYTFSSQPVQEGEADFSVPMPEGVPFNNQSVITEWQVPSVDANKVDTSSRREIMRVNDPQFNHNGGMLAFGPDGMLYASFGDGGAANDVGPGHVEGGNGQHPRNIFGTIIRIDPLGRTGRKSENGQYTIPDDNPFVGEDKEALDVVWAYGLRNAWRFSFDRESGRLVAADVGQGRIEEVDVIERGGNYGWRIKEGTFFFNPEGGDVSRTPWPGTPPHGELIDPVVQYDHDEGLSITGGYVYRGDAVPALQGLYVFGDWKAPEGEEGRLFYADLSSGEIHEMIIGKDDRSLGTYLSGFGEGQNGELYLLTNQESEIGRAHV